MRIHAFPHHYVVRVLTRLAAAASAILLIAGPALAQDAVEYALQSDSKLWVDGTSNKSDWTVHAGELTGGFGVTGSGSDFGLEAGEITVDSRSIESGKSTIMDRLMRDALKVDEHPTITYVLTSAEPGNAADDGSVTLNTTGELTLTGTTKDIEMAVTGTPAADGTIRFTGSHALKMSDYGMKPPTAMFGSLRTGDDVTVHFDVVVAPGE